MKKLLITLLGAAAMLSGCYYPEKFNAELTINPDASYVMNYDGTAVNVLALLATDGKLKQLTSHDDEELRGAAQKMTKAPGVKVARYEGNGRFFFRLNEERKPGQPLSMFEVFYVTTAGDGTMTIATPPIKPEDKGRLSKVGLKLDGRLSVKLPKNAEVISSNATGTPGVFSSYYTWNIGDVASRPLMRIRIKK